MMKGSKSKAGDPPATIKTSIKLNRDLWKRAHGRAMDDGVDLQDLIAAAIEAYLGKTKGGAR